jgi:hypothetical protein
MISRFNIVLFWIMGSLLMMQCAPSEESRKAQVDSLAYQYDTLTRTFESCLPETDTCTYVRFVFPTISVTGHLADSIQHMLQVFFNDGEGRPQPLDSIQQKLIGEYRAFRNESAHRPSRWNWDAHASVVSQNKSWIQFELYTGGYTGGAHDFGSVEYRILDKSTGRRLGLSDFFDPVKMPKLTQLGETEFCRVRQIPPHQSLEDAGFEFDSGRFVLPENFLILPDGIHFLYNAYEIGPYVLGETQFTLPANKVVPLMKRKD